MGQDTQNIQNKERKKKYKSEKMSTIESVFIVLFFIIVLSAILFFTIDNNSFKHIPEEVIDNGINFKENNKNFPTTRKFENRFPNNSKNFPSSRPFKKG